MCEKHQNNIGSLGRMEKDGWKSSQLDRFLNTLVLAVNVNMLRSILLSMCWAGLSGGGFVSKATLPHVAPQG